MKAALICLRTPRYEMGVEMTLWADAAEALEAERELCHPVCGPGCEGRHVVAWFEGDWHVTGTHPPPPPLEDELGAGLGDLLDGCPAPEEWNPPLDRPIANAALAERIERGRQAALEMALAEAQAPAWSAD